MLILLRSSEDLAGTMLEPSSEGQEFMWKMEWGKHSSVEIASMHST